MQEQAAKRKHGEAFPTKTSSAQGTPTCSLPPTPCPTPIGDSSVARGLLKFCSLLPTRLKDLLLSIVSKTHPPTKVVTHLHVILSRALAKASSCLFGLFIKGNVLFDEGGADTSFLNKKAGEDSPEWDFSSTVVPSPVEEKDPMNVDQQARQTSW
ncbi:hypothetical protein Salat_2396000 [Sesamum alatum]|uniref:Uncharacterized protein n=1 Tax=Sesamum alatum TaxID=300844 RepID=A0AAE1XXE8_9LAMI|nr:hypothetical protein Salat_2396000 [Sesamum alatum]